MFNRFFVHLIIAIAFSVMLSSCGGSGVKMAGITESQIEADPALMQLKKALDDDPENAQKYYDLAHYLENNGYEEAAISTYEQGLVKKPNNNEMLYELGRLQIKTGQETKGFQSFRKVMASVDAMSYVDKIGPYFLDVFSLSPIIYSSINSSFNSSYPSTLSNI